VDVLTSAQSLGLSVVVDETDHCTTTSTAHIKDDYAVVNRFDSMLSLVSVIASYVSYS